MKGFFTQGFVLLTDRPVDLEELCPFVGAPIVRMAPAGENWQMGGATAFVAFRPEVKGVLLIDTVGHPWPDHMGDPKSEPMLFGAWSMGHFGPLAFPGGLARAVQHSWFWPAAKEVVPRHRGFVRLRISYVSGAGPDAKVLPADYDARGELEFLTGVMAGLISHPSVLCYFNPNGEVVASAEGVADNIAHHRQHGIPALPLWTNVRFFNLSDGWMFMDTVGMGQLDVPDHEACYPSGSLPPGEVDAFLRNASLYVLTHGEVIKTGDTMDGPGDRRWQASHFEEGFTSPPRPAICWLPTGIAEFPAKVVDRSRPAQAESPPAPPKKSWWQKLSGG